MKALVKLVLYLQPFVFFAAAVAVLGVYGAYVVTDRSLVAHVNDFSGLCGVVLLVSGWLSFMGLIFHDEIFGKR